MTPEEPLDDDVFINANFLAEGPIQKAGVKTDMINPVSSASAVSQAVAPQNTAKPSHNRLRLPSRRIRFS